MSDGRPATTAKSGTGAVDAPTSPTKGDEASSPGPSPLTSTSLPAHTNPASPGPSSDQLSAGKVAPGQTTSGPATPTSATEAPPSQPPAVEHSSHRASNSAAALPSVDTASSSVASVTAPLQNSTSTTSSNSSTRTAAASWAAPLNDTGLKKVTFEYTLDAKSPLFPWVSDRQIADGSTTSPSHNASGATGDALGGDNPEVSTDGKPSTPLPDPFDDDASEEDGGSEEEGGEMVSGRRLDLDRLSSFADANGRVLRWYGTGITVTGSASPVAAGITTWSIDGETPVAVGGSGTLAEKKELNPSRGHTLSFSSPEPEVEEVVIESDVYISTEL